VIFEEAKRLAASGRAAEATALLQSAINDVADSAALAEERFKIFEMLLQLLFKQRRDGRMSKVFRQYVAEYCKEGSSEFDTVYLAGLLATRTSPLPLRRRDRFKLLIGQFERILDLEGLVAECGCFLGLSSFMLCSTLKRHNPAFDGAGYQIYDSFQGLSDPQPQDTAPPESGECAPSSANVRRGKFAASLEDVRRALAPFPRIEYFPGWIPVAFPATRQHRYRFVHVDVDLYEPTKQSFEYFWPRLAPRGVIVCDDYNWPGAKRAVGEFCAAAGIPFAVTPSQQAFFSRPAVP